MVDATGGPTGWLSRSAVNSAIKNAKSLLANRYYSSLGYAMRRNLAGKVTINSRLLAASLLITVGVGGCKFLKRGDSGPDAQASAVVSAAPVAPPSVAEMPSIAPVPSVPAPVLHPHRTTTSTGTKTSTSVATAASAAAASAASTQPVASAAPAASTPVIGAINPQCQAACQKGYQDCVTQSGGLSGMDLIKKCREVLMPCVAACK